MWISPNYQDTDFAWPLSLDNKINIFIDRTYGWQLDIAEQCINGRVGSDNTFIVNPIPHSGFAVLNIVLSYFEMIAKYQDGFTKNSKSEYYFKQGLYSVYPQLKNESTQMVDNLLDVLYFGCRCGLYHGGMTDNSILVTSETCFPLVFDPHELRLKINPHLLVPSLKLHLSDYETQLKDTGNLLLRKNFEKRFDFDALTRLSGSRYTGPKSSNYPENSTKGIRPTLPDILGQNLRVVFCNIGGAMSGQSATFYADARNRFWTVLFRVGLIPKPLSSEQSKLLPRYGIGLTELSLSKHINKDSQSDFDIEGLKQKVSQYSPLTLAFNGKRAAQEVYGYSVHYGLQPEPIASSTVFVLPSTSGIARKYWNEWYWRELADYINSHPDTIAKPNTNGN